MEMKVSVPCMEGGSGSDNYARNSRLQSYNFQAFAKPHLSHALDHFAHLFFLHYCRHGFPAKHPASAHTQSSHEHRDTLQASLLHDALPQETDAPLDNGIDRRLAHVVRLTVVDFGCSYGRNTLDYAAFIVQGLYNRLRGKTALYWPDGGAPPLQVEMQYFFSDLPSNNFNSLLQSLVPFFQEQLQCCYEGAAAAAVLPLKWKLFSGAVAGSFHGRLFPSGSLHLAISAYSVQWLSQIPPEVVDRASLASNGGHIWIHGTRPKVVEAYARQYQRDIKSFLYNRAEEIASGGILFLFFPCRYEKYPQGAFFTPQHDIWTGCFESTWEGMVLEGLITKEERDMFNIPFYVCHKSEMEDALSELLNKFKMVKIEVLRDCSNLPLEEEQKIKGDPRAFGKFVANFVASLMKPILQEYLGESRANKLCQRLYSEATKNAHLSTSISYDMLLVVIERL